MTDIHPGATRQERLERVVTRRDESVFATDFLAKRETIAARLNGRRVLVVGGAGSIGAITTRLLLDFEPAAVHVVDHNENGLAELVRDLRGRPEGLSLQDFRTIPIDYGSAIMERLLAEEPRYDIALNFAALKHVRSEKDTYSILQMLNTNLVAHLQFKQWLARDGHGEAYFAVSTDKAANPASIMGASKRLMEDLVFGVAAGHARSTTSARFANVAFSNGSLLQGFLRRIERRQPIAVPRMTQRYFISHREAGELCVLAALAMPDRHIAVPRMDPRRELQNLDEIAVRVLSELGFEAEFVEDEDSARRSVEKLARMGRWPVLLTPLDTSGEKPYEEFLGEGENSVDVGLDAIAAICHRPSRALEDGLFDRLSVFIHDPRAAVGKSDLIELIQGLVDNFRHVDTGRSLDQRL